MKSRITIDMLPPRARELAELIGLPALMSLVDVRGGCYLYIPERPNEQHPIARLIGLDATQALSSVHGGESIEIPTCVTALRALLHQDIRARRRAGESESSVAQDVGMWGRSIRRICAADPQDDDQPDLFG